MREIIHLNRGWEFVSECSEPFLQGMPVEGTESAELPHSSCPIPLHYFDPEICGKVSGYRRHLTADPAWEGKRIFAVFEGAAHSASVYLNGELLAEHHCGYTAFEVELTEHLRRGEDNLLAVLVDSRESRTSRPLAMWSII